MCKIRGRPDQVAKASSSDAFSICVLGLILLVVCTCAKPRASPAALLTSIEASDDGDDDDNADPEKASHQQRFAKQQVDVTTC